jgi:phosphorylcholine metabolism protein LicD
MDEEELERRYNEEYEKLLHENTSQRHSILNANLSTPQFQKAIESLKKQLHIKSEEDIVHASRADIQKVTRLSDDSLSDFLSYVSMPLCCNISSSTAWEMLKDESDSKTRRLSLGCPILDR